MVLKIFLKRTRTNVNKFEKVLPVTMLNCMLQLYPDQQKAKSDIYRAFNRGDRRVIYPGATGSGKTVITASIILDAIGRGKVALFIVDRIQLVKQTQVLLESLGLVVSIYQGGNTRILPNHNVIVASIQTLAQRRIPEVDLIIIDECHVFYKAHAAILKAYNNVYTIGLSATPLTRGLGLHFETLIDALTMKDLIGIGRLVPFTYYDPFTPDLTGLDSNSRDYNLMQLSRAMNTTRLIGNIVTEWQRLGDNRQTLLFAVDIAHSKACARRFNQIGVPSIHLDAYTSYEEKQKALKQYNDCAIRVLCSVGVLSLGYDAPITGCIIQARPTKSKMLYIQQVGRGPRTYAGKRDVIILDHAGNIRHGLPTQFKVNKLSMAEKKDVATPREESETYLIRCVFCGAIMEPVEQNCPTCKAERAKDSTVIELEGYLRRATPITQAEKNSFYWQLLYLCNFYKKKPGLAYHMYIEKYNEKPTVSRRLEAPSDEVKKYYTSRLIKAAYKRRKNAV